MPQTVVRRTQMGGGDPAAVLAVHAVSERGVGEPPMVLLHGFGTDQSIWRRLAPQLAARRRVVLYDHMGAGASDGAHYDPDRYASLKGYADDLVEILDALDLTDATVVGHSVSGMIALLGARRTDRIGRLVMIGASPRYLNDAGYEGGFERSDVEDFLGLMELDFQGWARQLAPRVLDQPGQPALEQELEFSFCRNDAEITRRFARATFLSDHRADLAHCRAPALVLQASRDVVVSQAAAEFLAAHIPGARLRMLEAAGHYPHLGAPDEVAAAIEAFLADVAPAGAGSGGAGSGGGGP